MIQKITQLFCKCARVCVCVFVIAIGSSRVCVSVAYIYVYKVVSCIVYNISFLVFLLFVFLSFLQSHI